MRAAQRTLADFLPLIDWTDFHRRNLNEEVAVDDPGVAACACGDEAQALVWLVRRDTLRRDGSVAPAATPAAIDLRVPGLAPGRYAATVFDTRDGAMRTCDAVAADGLLVATLPPVA